MLTLQLIELLAKVALEIAEDVVPNLIHATHPHVEYTEEQHQEAVQQVRDKMIAMRQDQSAAHIADVPIKQE